MHEPITITCFAKPIAAIALASGCYVADQATSAVTGLPDWIHQLGLPSGMLVAVIYALVATNKALRQSEEGRLRDRDEFLEEWKQHAKLSHDTRERIADASRQNAEAIRRLANEIANRPCHFEKPKNERTNMP